MLRSLLKCFGGLREVHSFESPLRLTDVSLRVKPETLHLLDGENGFEIEVRIDAVSSARPPGLPKETPTLVVAQGLYADLCLSGQFTDLHGNYIIINGSEACSWR